MGPKIPGGAPVIITETSYCPRRCSLGARNLLRSGWDSLPVRRHPDRALLQDQDLQRQRGQRWERKVKADCGRGHLHGFDSSQAGHI
ncbi:high affinity immunoglobulin epsilon receptor subunit gamma isoform X2 [Gambusia affinis]|uniref:high affinity immunoglobulin epsilon receptor subunit gamma isoform X2 n=1 Tax=Gambusia affinis TaxID=33528 RepID=UPI001CDD6157|nr:high affinity immunoglobulin epsilon receptor subunit gamma isoform X2 [Gambusia affinis]